MPKAPEKERFVKARMHQGSSSLDITIPSSMAKKGRIRDGDLFRVETYEEEGSIVLKYVQIYRTKR